MNQSTSEPVNLDALNRQFSLGKHLRFAEGAGGLPVAEMNSDRATASVSLHGGHVLSYQPEGFEPVLWLSEHSVFEQGKAIRGGIPVCWPWFGEHPTQQDRPNHGFARICGWSVFSARLINEEDVQLRLILSDDALTRSYWPHAFELEIHVTLSEYLVVELQVRNTGHEAFTYAGALHSYLNISHIDKTTVHGLDGCEYIDQLAPGPLKRQIGPIRFDRETDNVYLDTQATCILEDTGFNRRIVVEKAGSRSTVVWNPWIAKAERMPDFGNDEYQSMVCIETANVARNEVIVEAGKMHVMSAAIRAERMSYAN